MVCGKFVLLKRSSLLLSFFGLDGYLFEHGEFCASFAKDDRITTGLKVTIELNRQP